MQLAPSGLQVGVLFRLRVQPDCLVDGIEEGVTACRRSQYDSPYPACLRDLVAGRVGEHGNDRGVRCAGWSELLDGGSVREGREDEPGGLSLNALSSSSGVEAIAGWYPARLRTLSKERSSAPPFRTDDGGA